MVHRYASITFALASIIATSSGLEIKGLRIPEEKAASDDVDGWFKAEGYEEKGVKCKGSADKKKGVGKQCEGGIKQVKSFGVGAEELAEDASDNIRDMHSEMIDNKGILVPDEAMEELISWDNIDLVDIFGEEDCSEGKGCSKKVEFGGYVKAFWGCNITFSKKGKKMVKEVGCGFKSSEAMGKKEGSYYNELKEKKEL